MNILFVSSGNSKEGISPIVKKQGESLAKAGCHVDYFTIKGKGIRGYLAAVPALREKMLRNTFDVIHAHYSLSAFMVTLAGANPLVVSLMGSDVNERKWYKWLIRIVASLRWKVTIVKTESMKKSLDLQEVKVIPNGVDLQHFKLIDKKKALDKLGWNIERKHILFAANPNRYEKNFALAQQAYELVHRQNDRVELHHLDNVSLSQMPTFYSASDVVLLTSLWEGSPNVTKEAMACNCTIVSTNVGDVKEVIGETKGCFLCSYEPEDVAEKIKLALDYGRRTNGRENIRHLDEKLIADKIISLYKEILNG